MHPTKIYLAAEERKEDSRRKKRDEEKEENVGLQETHGAEIAAGSRRRSPLGLADRPTVCLCVCFFFVFCFFFLYNFPIWKYFYDIIS
jgi:hypothetical protein